MGIADKIGNSARVVAGAATGGAFGGLGSALISGGLSALGNILGAKKSGEDAKEAMEMQIKWELQKALNSHQWEMEDLKKAGLNPILAALNGAQAGSISPVTGDYSGYGRAGESYTSALQTKMQMESLKKTIQQQDADIEEKNALAELHKIQAISESLNNDFASARNAAEIPALKNQATYNKSDFGKYIGWTGRAMREISPALNLMGFGFGGIAAKRLINSATSALRTGKAINATNQAIKATKATKQAIPFRRSRLINANDYYKIPAIYRNGHKAR